MSPIAERSRFTRSSRHRGATRAQARVTERDVGEPSGGQVTPSYTGPHGRRRHGERHAAHRDLGRRLRALRRTPDNRVLGGVCGGVAHATGLDATWVRIGFVLVAIASGIMILVYALAWLVIPMEGHDAAVYARAVRDRRGIRLVAAVLIPTLIVVQLVTSSLHVAFVGYLGWPTLLRRRCGRVGLAQRRRPGAGVHRQRRGHHARGRLPRPLAPPRSSPAWPSECWWAWWGSPSWSRGTPPRRRWGRVGGALLVVAAIGHRLRAVVARLGPRPAGRASGPRPGRGAGPDGGARARLGPPDAGAHPALRRRPQNVVRLARARERELRAWLFEGRPPGAVGGDAHTMAEGVSALQRQVESDHHVAVPGGRGRRLRARRRRCGPCSRPPGRPR